MRLLSAKLAVIFVAVGLIICQAKAWGADWKEFAEATTGIFYYDKASVSSTPEGFLRVWIHNTTKHESSLIEIDCKEKNYRVLDIIEYDEASRIKDRHLYYDNSGWIDISQRTVPEPVHSILCP